MKSSRNSSALASLRSAPLRSAPLRPLHPRRPQFTGSIRYVSPALEANQRALTVEASVPNPNGELKPGLFATALIRQPKETAGILVPADAVRVSKGTSRVFVVNGDRVEERIVTIGQRVDAQLEIVNGLKAGERVATTNVPQLVDGARVAL